ncbi:hypothetical protein [Candidatus Phytoplasma australiense]|uniref:Uncharacterized protein n=1 Tax=Strawberry lethal yellows phytoplasma (CPA) str. NZSb11 TaxID=980422 RepID=R4RW84_PHYAS|nr:hypothetical protein [Candidatus Phytoplasma australiense]AGL90112.1 Hypothetical Protein SLY_0190 [Strawberry lethal yellows phytoplasma (CPA) str. NZSb11]AGL90515.1 Hypothetical Protein SLY_0600 [Strawberry lethal yellows phytoplasma (CPA) str. NZSb11]
MMSSFLKETKKRTKWDKKTFNEIIMYIQKILGKFCKEIGYIEPYSNIKNKEIFVTTIIKTWLEEIFGKVTTRESSNGHGKTDLILFFDDEIEHPIECKRYKGNESMEMLYKQVSRHTTVFNKTVSMIIYCEEKNFFESIKKITKWINDNVSLIKKPILNFNNYPNIFKGEFKHDYGHTVMLHCACYHLFFDKSHAKTKKQIAKQPKNNLK